jgi:hypothetical protein
MDTIDALISSNETAVKYVTGVQEQILEGLRTLAESATKFENPALSGLLPTSEPVPVRDVVEEAYSFNARLLELNKAFAINVLNVLTPAATPVKTSKKS